MEGGRDRLTPFARRLLRLHQGRHRSRRQLAALGRISRIAAVVDEPLRVLERVVEVVTRVLAAERSSVMLLDENGDLRIQAHRGLPEEVARATAVPLGQGIAGHVAGTGRPLLIPDIERDARFGRQNRPAYRSRSALCVPLQVNGRVIGVINVNDPADDRPFDREDLRLLIIVAGQAAMLIEKSRLLARLGRTVESLASSNRLNTAILDSIADGVVALADGRPEVRAINGPARMILAHPIERTLVSLEDLFPWPESRAAVEALLAAPGRVDPVLIRLPLPGRARGIRHVRVQVVALGESVEGAGRLLVLRDVTLDAELAERKREFVALISHELNTPLTTIRTYVDLLLQGALGGLPPGHREVLADVHQSVVRLGQEIEKLFWSHRLEVCDGPARRQPTDAAELVRQAVGWVRPAADLKQVRLICHCGPDDPPVLADSRSLEVAFRQILDNAVKFSPAGGLVEIEVAAFESEAGPRVRVMITDQGPGIPPWDRERIFEAFEQGEPHLRRSHGGLGVGLAIARKAIQWNCGRIYLDPPPAPGARFVIELDPAGAAEFQGR